MSRQFKKFRATELYCPNCKQAVPVKERLLLILPDGELYDYICTYCGESLGTKTTSASSASVNNIYYPQQPDDDELKLYG